MPISNETKNFHFLQRAGFGVNTNMLTTLAEVNTKELVKKNISAAQEPPVYLDKVNNSIKEMITNRQEDAKMKGEELGKNLKKELTAQEKRQIQVQSREDLKNLNLLWLDTMVKDAAPLREKMALFWHGHFASRQINVYYQQLLLHEIRKNAVGNFGDLLKAVSKSASMLSFLNNQQNRKLKPNENFAREVMELFTLGRGNYTEIDIKEAARAFTGWGFRLDGSFVFRQALHDDGVKTIFGKTGNFTGDDVLEMLLQNPQTAIHITEKIYRFFVNDVIDVKQVKYLADKFYKSNYNITTLLTEIFNSQWFYEAKNMGCIIKSPVALLVGIRKLLPMEIENPQIQLLLQRALGQTLFYPPNVAGWPGGEAWIDSSSLMLRLRLPQYIKDDDSIAIAVKTDDDVQMGMMENQQLNKPKIGKNYGGNQIRANVNWETFAAQFDKVPREALYTTLEKVVIPTKASPINANAVQAQANAGTRLSYIQSITIALMCTPEYQLS